MAQEHPTRIPLPVSGSNRTHRSIIIFTAPTPFPRHSQARTPSPTRSDLENAYRASPEEQAAPRSDQLLSLREILSAPAPTPLERAMIRPLSCDFNQAVNIYDCEGGWTQRGVKKGGLSNLRVAHDTRETLGPQEPYRMLGDDEDEQDNGEIWSEVEQGKQNEGYNGVTATLLASFEEVAALQDREQGKGMKPAWWKKTGWKKQEKLEISWPTTEYVGAPGAFEVINEGTETLKSMALQAISEGREARVEQIALRVRDLVHSLTE